MALARSTYPRFTIEVCRRNILREPFCLIDIGVRGGIGDQWIHFGDHLQILGFDPLFNDGVGPLIASNPHPDRWRYFNVALGDKDEIRPFKFLPDNPSSSHFAASNGTDAAAVDGTWLPMELMKIDTLYSNGTIGSVDFVKMDAETYEIEIVRGGERFFSQSGTFGIETETHFLRTPRNPRSHFAELYELLAAHRFNVYDASGVRSPRSLIRHGLSDESRAVDYCRGAYGRSVVFDFLLLHDDFEHEAGQKQRSIDKLIKMIAVAEIYSLKDVGLDILFANQDRLQSRLDVDEAADWLFHN